ncbi:MAG: FG-GAP repeat protein [Acidimicrobiales bacterium]|jgi:FG-GAP repeat protein
MGKSRIVALLGLASASAIVLPMLAFSAAATAASQQTAPPVGRQLAEIKGSDTVSGDAVGVSVAISGTTAVVGAPGYANDIGLVYVFSRTAKGWRQAAELKGSGTVAGDFFGYSVAISGTTVVVGAPGYAKNAGRIYVFARATTRWRQVAELKASGIGAGDYLGDAVAVSGPTAVVGADGLDKNAGRAYVFTDVAKGWRQAAELKGSDTVSKDGFGYTVATSGATAIVGAPDHAKSSGRAYVFVGSGASWNQVAELKGSDTGSDTGFGVSAAMSGTTAVIGAPGYKKATGRAYVFASSGVGWEQVAELKGSGTVGADDFGYAVAISGTTLVAGAPGYSKNAGRTYLFAGSGQLWKQIGSLKGSDTAAGDYLGYSVGISGDVAVAGADGHSKSAGRAYLFEA